jgi:hypothetical protein
MVPIWQPVSPLEIRIEDQRSQAYTSTDEWSVSRACLEEVFHPELRPTVDAFASRSNSLCDKFLSKWPQVGAVVIRTISIASLSSSPHVTATTMTAKHHCSPCPARMEKWTILGHAAGRLRFHHGYHQLGGVKGALLQQRAGRVNFQQRIGNETVGRRTLQIRC